MRTLGVLILLIFPMMLISCSDTVPTSIKNPIAVAGTDQALTLGSSVVLDGASSFDPKSKTLTFSWAFGTIPPVTGSSLTNASFTAKNADNSLAEFTPDKAGNYVIVLTVSNGVGSDTDSVLIQVTNNS